MNLQKLDIAPNFMYFFEIPHVVGSLMITKIGGGSPISR